MSAEATLQIGSTLGGRFQIHAEIGEGGFGKIYRARQLNVDRDVALKVLPPEFSTMENVVERFRREARLASKLQHPNTITIYDYGQEEGHFFIAMEYLKGEDLGDRIYREQILGIHQAIHIAKQTLQSLKEAHQLGIIHRDLKPENIFLTNMGDGEDFVKVLDFGIAKMASLESGDHLGPRGRQLTVQGSTVGTPAYMSPEQAAGEAVGPPSDLYTLGLILYEMVNGRPPFVDERPIRIMRAHLFDPLPGFTNKELKGTHFESIVRKALEKKPELRFACAEEFLEALSQKNIAQKAFGFIELPKRDAPITPEQPSSASTKEKGVDETNDEIPFESIPSFPTPHENPPPLGFSREESSITSSIITVLEEPSPEDVILLTDLKPREIQKPPKAPSRGEEWSWHQEVARPDASGSQILTDFKPLPNRRPLFLGLILTAIVIVLLVLLSTNL